MRVEAFGRLVVVDGVGEWVPAGGGLQGTAFGVLCVTPGESVSLGAFADALWGDTPPDRYARSLATYMSSLRSQLGVGIESSSGGYRLELDRAQVTTSLFADFVSHAGGDVSELRSALELWAGEPFAGLEGHGMFRDERIRLAELRLVAARGVARDDIDSGRSGEAVRGLVELVEVFPYDEQIRGLHMEALFRTARQAEAIRSFSTFRERLVDELGVEPSADLRDLELAILNQEILDIGEGVAEPRSSGAIPRRYSSLIGRDAEMADVRRRLGQSRLVSLIGPGGIGKSTIAAEVARGMVGECGVVIVSIESLSAGDVAKETAGSMGLEPAAGVDPVVVIEGYLESRPHLVVMDGCEPRIDEVSDLVDRLLSSTDCRVLVTSREPLGLVGESTVRVDPLPIDDAVQLFVDRAEVEDPTSDVLATFRSVCEAVDSMPLAVELAASRSRSLPLDRLSERLGDLIPLLKRSRGFDERHGSILAALDWSYDLLNGSEQETLMTISVFRTPFRSTDAAELTGNAAAEDIVGRLVDASLLQPPDPAGEYRFLEPIRQYARHQLDRHGRVQEIRGLHRDWVVASCRQAARDEWTPRIREVCRWIFDKRYEMAAAIEFAEQTDDPDSILAIVGAVGRRLTGSGVQGFMVNPALNAINNPQATRGTDWIQSCTHTSWMVAREGRLDEAEALVRRGIGRAEQIDASAGVLADALRRLAAVVGVRATGQSECFELMERAFSLTGPDDEGLPPKYWLFNKAIALNYVNRIDEAAEVMELHRQWWEAEIREPSAEYHLMMSRYHLFRGDPDQALRDAERSAQLAEGLRMYHHARNGWENMAEAACIVNDTARLREAATRRRRITEITGEPLHLPTEIALASSEQRHDDVLSIAKTWFSTPLTEEEAASGVLSGDRHLDVYGTASQPPAIFPILRFVAGALDATGNRDAACRIANSLPGLIAESEFEYWTERREEALWEPLVNRCSDETSSGEPLDLATLLDYVEEQVTHRTPTAQEPM